jgi:hypothetical protein
MSVIFSQLRSLRASNVEYNPAVAREHGAYAAGSPNYSCGRDVMPYLFRLRIVRRWWQTESAWVKLAQVIGALMCITAAVLIIMGSETWTFGRYGVFRDVYNLGRTGWILLLVGGVLFIGATLWRSVWKGAAARKERLRKLENEQSELGTPMAVQEYGAVNENN